MTQRRIMTQRMEIKIKKLSKTAKIPTRATDGSAGYDLYADSNAVIRPGETVMIDTGIALEIPEGYFGAIYPRSGLASKKCLRLANCVGVIDSDYRGPIGIPMHNDHVVDLSYEGLNDEWITKGDRIAQIIFQPYLKVDLIEADELSKTERGEGGFGSTGK